MRVSCAPPISWSQEIFSFSDPGSRSPFTATLLHGFFSHMFPQLSGRDSQQRSRFLVLVKRFCFGKPFSTTEKLTPNISKTGYASVFFDTHVLVPRTLGFLCTPCSWTPGATAPKDSPLFLLPPQFLPVTPLRPLPTPRRRQSPTAAH